MSADVLLRASSGIERVGRAVLRRCRVGLVGAMLFGGVAASATALVPVSPDVGCGFDDLTSHALRHAFTATKAGAAAPSEIRWAALHCQFSNPNGVPVTHEFLRDAFERPVDGLFAHFARMSQGRTVMTLPVVVDVPMNRASSSFTYNSHSELLEKLSEACLSAAEPLVDFSDIDGLAFFFNNAYSPLANGSRYNAALEGEQRVVQALWMPAWVCGGCVNPPGHTIGVLAHEMGHSFNLRHANNSDNDGYAYDNAWDYMSLANGSPRDAGQLWDLPYSLHAQSRLELGWLDEQQVLRLPTDLGPFEEVVRIDFNPAGSGVQLVRIDLPGVEDVLLTARSPSNRDDSGLPGPVVFVHTHNPARLEPLWVFDAGIPVPSGATTDTSYFTAGEVYQRDIGDNTLTVRVLAASEDGYEVSVSLGVDPAVFLDGFE